MSSAIGAPPHGVYATTTTSTTTATGSFTYTSTPTQIYHALTTTIQHVILFLQITITQLHHNITCHHWYLTMVKASPHTTTICFQMKLWYIQFMTPPFVNPLKLNFMLADPTHKTTLTPIATLWWSLDAMMQYCAEFFH